VKGLELITAWQLAGFEIEANAARIDASNDATGLQLPRRAKTNVSASIAQQLGPWNWRVQARATGKRFDDAANTRSLDAFEVFDVALARQVCQDWSARVRIDNIADKRYQTVYAYNQPARQIWLTLEYRPK
jgi:vitamin B12 transporter